MCFVFHVGSCSEENDVEPAAASSNEHSDAQIDSSLEDLKQRQNATAAAERGKGQMNHPSIT